MLRLDHPTAVRRGVRTQKGKGWQRLSHLITVQWMHASETPLIHIFDPRAEQGGDQNRCCFIDLALQIENLDEDSERVEANRIEFNEEVTAARNLPVTFFDGLNGERVELIKFANFEV